MSLIESESDRINTTIIIHQFKPPSRL